ncbi:Altered inheritance of mitochondria protein 24, mitochondrial [Loxospora ochrophaea]|nr:Altered inheritance of mitochondria protein 24, mitochondrial [Loxospora ochrophaea]
MRYPPNNVITSAVRTSRNLTTPRRQWHMSFWRRSLQISATPSDPSPFLDLPASEPSLKGTSESPDAKFEVLGAPYSLLSASLSASQNLYTRRGTLVGVSGKAENVGRVSSKDTKHFNNIATQAVSTLSLLEPFRRAVLGIPFLYQKISSTTPITALISSKSSITSFAVVHLDGTLDWMVSNRQSLLAWTGHTLSISPTINRRMSLAYWGNSQITGRGLLALTGKGQIYQVSVKAGEEYVAHPSNVIAYTITQTPPLPYRLKSSSFRLQIPSETLSRLLPDTRFFKVMRQSDTWKALTRVLFNLRTWSRRTIWGDRLFLHFRGPTTILLQTRASRLSDVLTSRDVNEIADTPAGEVQAAVTLASKSSSTASITSPSTASSAPNRLNFASIGQDGKVEFQETDSFRV